MDYVYVEQLVKQTKSIIEEKDSSSFRLKGDADFVTEVDIAVSTFLKRELHALYPEIGFFSEEESGSLCDNCWILDPIDGTTNLVYGYNLSSVSLGHYLNGEIVYGIVFNPFNGEVFTAQKGQGAYLNHQTKLIVSNRSHQNSIIEFGAGSTHKENADVNFTLAKEIFKQCVDVRRICSSALDLCFIAAGRIDGYFERVLKPWDIAAGSLILTEAGGKITDYDGAEVQFSNSTSVIASNTVVHDFLKDMIGMYGRQQANENNRRNS